MASNPPLEYGWNPGAARYVDLNTGRFVAQQSIVGVMDARITEGIDRLQAMSQGVLNGTVPVEALQDAGIVELRRIHTQLGALGRGGWAQMAPEDWLRVGRQLKFEYRHWRDFMSDLAAGNLTEAQIAQRLQMYADHAWTSYWQLDEVAKRAAGAVEERNILNDTAAHCGECPELTSRGWQPIGSMPPPGARECLSGCKCRMERRTADGKVL